MVGRQCLGPLDAAEQDGRGGGAAGELEEASAIDLSVHAASQPLVTDFRQ